MGDDKGDQHQRPQHHEKGKAAAAAPSLDLRAPSP
jgi:hypothetical protein